MWVYFDRLPQTRSSIASWLVIVFTITSIAFLVEDLTTILPKYYYYYYYYYYY